MVSDVEVKLIYKFLESSYPISKVKCNGRFRCCIILDGGLVYVLSDKSHMANLRNGLFNILIKAFELDPTLCKDIVYKFLRN